MTLDRAIEILQDLHTTLPQFPPEDRREAVRMATRALACIKHYRQDSQPQIFKLLLDDTQE